MWLTTETDDEYVVRGVPIVFWLAGGALLAAGVFAVAQNLNEFLAWAKPVDAPLKTLGGSIFLLFLPATALILLAFVPLIETRINRKQRTIFYSRIGLLGRHTRKIAFDHVRGGVHIIEERGYEGGRMFTAHFKLVNGERLKMCVEPGEFQGRNYEVGMKANEFLLRKELGQASGDIVTLDL